MLQHVIDKLKIFFEIADYVHAGLLSDDLLGSAFSLIVAALGLVQSVTGVVKFFRSRFTGYGE